MNSAFTPARDRMSSNIALRSRWTSGAMLMGMAIVADDLVLVVASPRSDSIPANAAPVERALNLIKFRRFMWVSIPRDKLDSRPKLTIFTCNFIGEGNVFQNSKKEDADGQAWMFFQK